MSKGWKYGIGLGVVILLLFAGNLLVGSVSIPPADVFRILLGGEGEKASWSFILWESRLPQALTALLGCLRTDVADGFQESAGRTIHSGHQRRGKSGSGLRHAAVWR
jgi:hypothetical protein